MASVNNPDPKTLSMDGKVIFKVTSPVALDPIEANFQLDRNWVKNAFMVPDEAMNQKHDDAPASEVVNNRYWSSANFKFTSTRLGDNIGVNPRPQFTPYADIPVPGRLGRKPPTTTSCNNVGMGRYYSEAIDDPSQTVYFRFGVPQHNSISNFFTNAFDGSQAKMTRTGKYPVIYNLAKAITTVSATIAFPAVALLVLSSKTINRYLGSSTSYRYYTLKPTMHLYWGTVQTLVNTLAINSGLVPKLFSDELSRGQVIGRVYKLDTQYLEALHKLMPGIFPSYDSKEAELKPASIIDIFAVSLKAQKLADQVFIEEYEKLDNDSIKTLSDFTGIVRKERTGEIKVSNPNQKTNEKTPHSLGAWLNYLVMNNQFKQNEKEPSTLDPRVDDSEEGKKEKESWYGEFKNYFASEIRDGAQFATFRVDFTGASSESFSNTSTESEISQKLNGMSSGAKSTRFSMMDGNIGGGAIGSAVSGLLGMGKDAALGAASGLTFGLSDNIVAMLTGIGYIDIPKVWQNSNASLPRANYTIQLTSPYGNVFSMLQNIYIPLSMLLAGALPRSTGRASYTSPFLCQVFDRGRVQIRLGMIESLSITRGTSNLAFNLMGMPLAIDVSVSVVDLSSIMHMPVTSGGLLDNEMTFDESNILSDYLAVLAGQDLGSQMYALPKAKMKLAKDFAEAGKLTSPAYWGSNIGDTLANRLPFIYGPLNSLVSSASTVSGPSEARPG